MALTIEVTTNAAEVSRFMRRLFADQIPFAVSKAINETALEFQREQREGMEDRFTIRRPWVLQGVKINRGDFATKTKPEAIVRIDSSRDFLTKFERGGRKKPRRGSRIAIPDEARRTKTGVVSRAQRPRAFAFQEQGQSGRVARGRKRTFLIRRGAGEGVILQRLGRKGRSRVRRLYVFSPDAEIQPMLEFEETAERIVRDRFEPNFSRAFDQAIASAR